MSEAMTNPEIEDVLASIRRLVAQDRRPRPERLILTEEYRVRQANIPSAPLFPHAPAGAPASPAPAVPQADDLGEAVAEVLRLARAEIEPAPPPAEPAGEAIGQPAADLSGLEASIRDLEARIPGPDPAQAPSAGSAPAESAPADSAQADAVPPPAAQGEIVADDVAFIDEDDLERMVARLVREELRGQLGERITLQVRKLVRAEIARALDERNLLG